MTSKSVTQKENDFSDVSSSSSAESASISQNSEKINVEEEAEASQSSDADRNNDEEADLSEMEVILPNWVSRLKEYFEFVKQESYKEPKTQRTRTRFTLKCLICQKNHKEERKEQQRVSRPIHKTRKKIKDTTTTANFTLTSKSSDGFKRHLQVWHVFHLKRRINQLC